MFTFIQVHISSRYGTSTQAVAAAAGPKKKIKTKKNLNELY